MRVRDIRLADQIMAVHERRCPRFDKIIGRPRSQTANLINQADRAGSRACQARHEISVGGPRAPLGPIERHAPVTQRDIGVVADHQVVEQLDVEQPAGGQCLGCQMQVVG